MCKNCEETAKRQAADVGSQLRVEKASVNEAAYAAPARRIEVQEVENGFLVTFRQEPKAYALLSSGLAGFPNDTVFVAANLEAVTEIILTEGRKAR